jgi:hypothetical protein
MSWQTYGLLMALAILEVGLHRGAREQHLDRDRALQVVAFGGPDLAHSAASEQPDDAITCKNVARVDRHETWIGTVPREPDAS